MQNPETPTNLVEEELSLRALTLVKDRNRLREETLIAEARVAEKAEELRKTEDRLQQILSARFSYLPDRQVPTGAFIKSVSAPLSRTLRDSSLDWDWGTEIRILAQSKRGSYLVQYLVTTDESLPAVEDPALADAIGHLDNTAWVPYDVIEKD